MVLLRFARKEFLFLGLILAGFSDLTIGCTGDGTNHERFKDHFYASPKTVYLLPCRHFIYRQTATSAVVADVGLLVGSSLLLQSSDQLELARRFDAKRRFYLPVYFCTQLVEHLA